MEDKTIEKVDFSIEKLETNYYECTFDKCNFSDKPIGRVIFEKCTFKECNLSLVKTSNTALERSVSIKSVFCKSHPIKRVPFSFISVKRA